MENKDKAIKTLYDGLSQLNISISKEQEEKLFLFYEMLIEKNKVMNLTTITEINEVVVKHFLDSLSLVKVLSEGELSKKLKVIDVGTGAGFPGIPLKIVFPNLSITLLDSLNKRLVFLQEVIEKLELKDIDTVHGRCEDIGRKEDYREQYDLCVSRAVANLSTLSELCLPFVKKGGEFVSYKAGDCKEEVVAAKYAVKKLGGKTKKIVEFNLPNTDMSRVFVEIIKENNTPKAYPRKAGTPLKQPLAPIQK